MECTQETFFNTVSIFDRYFSKVTGLTTPNTSYDYLELAVVTLFIAIKTLNNAKNKVTLAQIIDLLPEQFKEEVSQSAVLELELQVLI